MSEKKVILGIEKTIPLDISEITPFQGELKLMSLVAKNKLRKQILETNFNFVIHVWKDPTEKDTIWIIDGHQRWVVLTDLRNEGYLVPKIPCAFVTANSKQEAKERVFQAISQYGKLQKHGFLDFIENDVFELETNYDFPDFNVDFDKLLSLSNKGGEGNEGSPDNEETDDEDTTQDYQLTVNCKDEDQQELLYEELQERGFECRIKH